MNKGRYPSITIEQYAVENGWIKEKIYVDGVLIPPEFIKIVDNISPDKSLKSDLFSKKEAAPKMPVQEQSKEISILLDGNKIANVLTNYLSSHGNGGEVPK